MPPEWVFEDDGFSGTRLDRPGLEAVRDLAAEGRIEAVLVLSSDRLGRRRACWCRCKACSPGTSGRRYWC